MAKGGAKGGEGEPPDLFTRTSSRPQDDAFSRTSSRPNKALSFEPIHRLGSNGSDTRTGSTETGEMQPSPTAPQVAAGRRAGMLRSSQNDGSMRKDPLGLWPWDRLGSSTGGLPRMDSISSNRPHARRQSLFRRTATLKKDREKAAASLSRGGDPDEWAQYDQGIEALCMKVYLETVKQDRSVALDKRLLMIHEQTKNVPFASLFYTWRPVAVLLSKRITQLFLLFVASLLLYPIVKSSLAVERLGKSTHRHFRFTAMGLRNGQHKGIQSPQIDSFGLLLDTCKVKTPFEQRVEGPSLVLSFAEDVTMNGWYIRTAETDPDLDPVMFIIEGASDKVALEGGEWATVGASVWRWFGDSTILFLSVDSGMTEERLSEQQYMLSVGWPWVFSRIVRQILNMAGLVLLACCGLFKIEKRGKRILVFCLITGAVVHITAAIGFGETGHPLEATYACLHALGVFGVCAWIMLQETRVLACVYCAGFYFFVLDLLFASLVWNIPGRPYWGRSHGDKILLDFESVCVIVWNIISLVMYTHMAKVAAQSIEYFAQDKKVYDTMWDAIMSDESRAAAVRDLYLVSSRISAAVPHGGRYVLQTMARRSLRERGTVSGRSCMSTMNVTPSQRHLAAHIRAQAFSEGEGGEKERMATQQNPRNLRASKSMAVASLYQLYAQARGLNLVLRGKVKAWARMSAGCFFVRNNNASIEADASRPTQNFYQSVLGRDRGMRGSVGIAQHHSQDVEVWEWDSIRTDETRKNSVAWTPVKGTDRAIEKLLRCFGRNVSRLVDVCREMIIFREIEHLTQCLETIERDEDVVIERIKNRLDPNRDSSSTVGYRDVLLNLRIVTGETKLLGLDVHVCEIQLVLHEFALQRLNPERHQRYIELRNKRDYVGQQAMMVKKLTQQVKSVVNSGKRDSLVSDKLDAQFVYTDRRASCYSYTHSFDSWPIRSPLAGGKTWGGELGSLKQFSGAHFGGASSPASQKNTPGVGAGALFQGAQTLKLRGETPGRRGVNISGGNFGSGISGAAAAAAGGFWRFFREHRGGGEGCALQRIDVVRDDGGMLMIEDAGCDAAGAERSDWGSGGVAAAGGRFGEDFSEIEVVEEAPREPAQQQGAPPSARPGGAAGGGKGGGARIVAGRRFGVVNEHLHEEGESGSGSQKRWGADNGAGVGEGEDTQSSLSSPLSRLSSAEGAPMGRRAHGAPHLAYVQNLRLPSSEVPSSERDGPRDNGHKSWGEGGSQRGTPHKPESSLAGKEMSERSRLGRGLLRVSSVRESIASRKEQLSDFVEMIENGETVLMKDPWADSRPERIDEDTVMHDMNDPAVPMQLFWQKLAKQLYESQFVCSTLRPADILDKKLLLVHKAMESANSASVIWTSTPAAACVSKPVFQTILIVMGLYFLFGNIHSIYNTTDTRRSFSYFRYRFTVQELRNGDTGRNNIANPHVDFGFMLNGCLVDTQPSLVLPNGPFLTHIYDEPLEMNGYYLVTAPDRPDLDPYKFTVEGSQGLGQAWHELDNWIWARGYTGLPQERGKMQKIELRPSWPEVLRYAGGTYVQGLGFIWAAILGMKNKANWATLVFASTFAISVPFAITRAVGHITLGQVEESFDAWRTLLHVILLGLALSSMQRYLVRIIIFDGLLYIIGDIIKFTAILHSPKHIILGTNGIGYVELAIGLTFALLRYRSLVAARRLIKHDKRLYSDAWHEVLARDSQHDSSSVSKLKKLVHKMCKDVPQENLRQLNRLEPAPGKATRGTPVRSLDQLYAQAQGMHFFLLHKVRMWALESHGCFPFRTDATDLTAPVMSDGGLVAMQKARPFFVEWEAAQGDRVVADRIIWGQVKSVNRAIEKVLRSYGRDVSRLVDVCRQMIIFREMEQLIQCLEEIDRDEDVVIERIKNRLDPSYDATHTVGYRDVMVNLRIVSSETRTLGLDMHICELQLVLQRFAELRHDDGHKRFIKLRNARGE